MPGNDRSILRLSMAFAVVLVLSVVGFAGEALAQACIGSPVQTNQTCSNSATLADTSSNFAFSSIGLQDQGSLTLTNTGAITATGNGAAGIVAVSVNVDNYGTITGLGSGGGSGYGITASNIHVNNWGNIIGAGANPLGGNALNGGNIDVANWGNIIATGGNSFIGFPTGSVAIGGSSATIMNYGTVAATGGAGFPGGGFGGFGWGVVVNITAGVSNWGRISGTGGAGLFAANAGGSGYGIAAPIGTANVSNWGSISGVGGAGNGSLGGVGYGVYASTAHVFNCGTISGTGGTGTTDGVGYGVFALANATVTNCGVISGSTAALNFAGGADTLTLLAGSRMVGAINLGGGGDTVNFRGGNHNLTFDTLAGATVTGTTPFAVSGNQAAAIDLTPFVANWRSAADFARGVSDAVPVFSGSVPGGGGPLAFAGQEAPSRFDDAFASIPGLASAYAGEAMVFKAPTATYADGTTVWARGFAGQRIQQQDGALLRNTNLFYGGMIGGDFVFSPDLRVGVFLGGGQTRSRIELGQGGTDSDLLFGGAYARYDIGASFLHGAIQGGSSRNTTTRTINNNLLANGLETATASYNGWYVSPEATFGHRFALGKLADATYTLTPSLRVRYLYGSFDGYSETGTTAPLTIGGQAVSTLEERGEVKLTRTVTFTPQDQFSASLFGGALGTQRLGNSTVNAVLLGQAIPFATPGKADVWGGFGGLGMEWRTRNVTIYSAAEYLALSDNSSIASGRAGLRVAF